MQIPQELCLLAQACLQQSEDLSDGWTGVATALVLPGLAAGDTPGAATLLGVHATAADAAGTALGRLVSVLEEDCDDVYAAAFAFSTTDEAAAGRLKGTYDPPPQPTPGPQRPRPGAPTPPPPTPSPSPGPAPTPSPTPTA